MLYECRHGTSENLRDRSRWDKVKGDTAVASPHEISCDDLSNMLTEYSPDSYTFVAGIKMTDFGFNQAEKHAIEISDVDNGHTKFWSWGNAELQKKLIAR